MKNIKQETKVTNDFTIEFLTKTIPHYAADPGWRCVFEGLANLSEDERAGMLQQLGNNIIPSGLSGLVSKEQLSMGLAFLRLNLEEPLNPRMMVKMIDYENHRVQKTICDQLKHFMSKKSDFNPTEFIMDAFFRRPLSGATWSDVLQACAELSDSERTSYLELLLNAPYDCNILGAINRLLIHNLRNPSHAKAMIHAIDEALEGVTHDYKALA